MLFPILLLPYKRGLQQEGKLKKRQQEPDIIIVFDYLQDIDGNLLLISRNFGESLGFSLSNKWVLCSMYILISQTYLKSYIVVSGIWPKNQEVKRW